MSCKAPVVIDWAMLSGLYSGSGLLMLDAAFEDVLRHARSSLAYLATPYSKEVLDARGQWSAVRSELLGHEAATWAGHLAVNGVSAISPIIQSSWMVSADFAHNIDPLDDVFWINWCRPLLVKADLIIIPPLNGWDRSRGIWHEVWQALHNNKPVLQIRPGTEFGGAL